MFFLVWVPQKQEFNFLTSSADKFSSAKKNNLSKSLDQLKFLITSVNVCTCFNLSLELNNNKIFAIIFLGNWAQIY